ncbi:t-SNARE [Podospora appendiculata]|uniref:t-SNARE n=1 Tax=Podospora appendiculata TaxID=314037 RepID=A0AAE0XCV8_9PEZI|nr:t-SNARE [Podospora appendiculata]
MDQYGYGARSNPFDQRDDSPGGGYGAPAPSRTPIAAFGQGPRPGGGAGGRYNQIPDNVEMAPLAQNAGSFGGQGSGGGDPNAILNECRDVDRSIDEIEGNLNQLQALQTRALGDADTSSGSSTSRQLDALSAETMSMYRSLTDRVRKIKSNPDSRQPRNTAQVNRVDRRLKQAIQKYQTVEASYRKDTQKQVARQYRLVRPEVSEAEALAAVEDTGGSPQIFQQALMQGSRLRQGQAVLSAVQDRHAALQKIEQQMIELAQLFEQLNTLIVEQDVAVTAIEQKSEEVVEDLDKGNVEIAVAVKTAAKTRRKKWICLGIGVSIILIIVIVVVAYIMINKAANSPKKRDVQLAPRSTVAFAGERPISRVYAQSKIVTPNSGYDAKAPLAAFPGSGRTTVGARSLDPDTLSTILDAIVDPHKPSAPQQKTKARRDLLLDADTLQKIQDAIVDPHKLSAPRPLARARRFVVADDFADEHVAPEDK